MDLQRLEALLLRVESLIDSSDERYLEIDARLTVNRYLLEHVYARAFENEPEALGPFMDSLIDSTRAATTTQGPMAPDDKVEMQVRVATHLARFSASVKLRLDPR